MSRLPQPARPVAVANRHPRLRAPAGAVARVIATLEAAHARIAPRRPLPPEGELSVVFLTDPDLADLHRDFLNDPTTTDVITFEGQPGLGSAGEICVSADTAATYARAHGRSFATELTLYVVHGWLHLCGYDDLEPPKKRAMRRAEARALRELARAGVLPAFAWKPARRRRR
jgi:probable rRNA maturation factor